MNKAKTLNKRKTGRHITHFHRHRLDAQWFFFINKWRAPCNPPVFPHLHCGNNYSTFSSTCVGRGPVIGVSTSSLMLRTSPRGPCNCFPILLLKKLRLREGENTGFYKHRFQDVLTRNRSFLPLFTCSSGSVSLTDKLQEENNEHLGPFPAASCRHGAALCL